MKILYTERHALHHGRGELNDGIIMPCHERPDRAHIVRRALETAGGHIFLDPDAHDDAAILGVHDADYLDFLRTVWPRWVAERGLSDDTTPDVLPLIWPVRSLRAVRPRHIDGVVSYHAMDAGTPIMRGTWDAVRAGADAALTAARMVSGDGEPVFVLTRPPGHHASTDQFGGYCYLNNAAICAQGFRDAGADRVAILDVDYHHGNGTQAIFEARGDVLVINIHADPRDEFPYFLGYAEETGIGAGEGSTVNLPLPHGTAWDGYAPALETALARLRAFGPDALVISWGFDTYEHDPISKFKLVPDDFAWLGTAMAGLRLPTAIIMEGGYAVEALGTNVVKGLEGFMNR